MPPNRLPPRTHAFRRPVLASALAPVLAPVLGWAAPALGGDLALQPRAGAPLVGLSAKELELFTIGQALYVRPISPLDGLGPIFNKSNCGSCHSTPLGGWGSISVTHFGFEDKGKFIPMDELGGSLLQAFSISEGCREIVPFEANFTTIRVTNSSLAFGLVEAIPDAAIAAREDPFDADGDGISGRVHWTRPVEAAPDSPLRAGRFGWKAQIATILTFSAEASREEMGLTNRFFPTENAPNGDFERLAQCDEVPDPEDTIDEEGYGFIDRVTHFQRYLGPPPQTPRSGMAGEIVFHAIGCAKCHVPEWTTADDPTLEAALRNRTIRPYSDFLLHEMGLLADGLPQGMASESEFRTPTLWNLRTRDPMLHDGSAAGGTFADRVGTAILRHGPFGEGAASAAAFAGLPAAERSALVSFLDSLGRLEFDLDGDNDVGIGDFLALRDCLAAGGPIGPDHPCAVADIDADGTLGPVDFGLFRVALGLEAADCNRNGVDDLVDLLLGTSADSDGDFRPDECMACPGDFDASGAVNSADLAILLGAWGGPGGDLDFDGVTGASDLTILLGSWGACR